MPGVRLEFHFVDREVTATVTGSTSNPARVFLLPLFLLLYLVASSAWAQDILFVMDTSDRMAASCPNGNTTFSRLLQQAVKNELDGSGRNPRTALIGFGTKARLLTGFEDQGKSIPQLIPHVSGPSRAGALQDGLMMAQGLLRRARAPTSLVLIGTGDTAESGPELTQHIAMLRGMGAEVSYVAIGPLQPGTMQTLQGTFSRVLHRPCPGRVVGLGDKHLIGQLRQLASRQSGIPESLFDADTEFVANLGMDRFAAYEIMSAACVEQGVATPERDDLTTLRKIADYLATAPLLAPAGQIVRGNTAATKSDQEPVYTQTVFYATNRKRMRGKVLGDKFGGDRAFKGRISYGRCEVSIPVTAHQRGSLETPFLSLDYFSDPQKHVLLRRVDVLDRRAFLKQIRKTLSTGTAKFPDKDDILVFIHGFNVSFEKAARRTAQVAYDLNFKGAPLFFSWPSNGALYAYISDREDIAWSVPHIADFLQSLAKDTRADRIHIIAHSMGHEGLLRALNQLALERRGEKTPMFENIIMAAPDFDAEIFADQIAPKVRSIAKHWTLYASDKDVALNISSKLRLAERLGLPLTVVSDVVTIDATGVEVTPWSVPEFHSYYATKQRVISDIISVLHGKAPKNRRSLTSAKKGRLPYWRLSGL